VTIEIKTETGAQTLRQVLTRRQRVEEGAALILGDSERKEQAFYEAAGVV
jgi:hypothetical protein